MGYLEHVVDDVEFDDGLSSDQVVHHGVIHIMHHGEAEHQDQASQHVTHLCWLQKPRPTDHTHTHTHTQTQSIGINSKRQECTALTIPVYVNALWHAKTYINMHT